MEIIKLSAVTSNIPVPAEGQRDPYEPPIKYGLERIAHTVMAVNIPDPSNIVVSEGTTPQNSLGATASLVLGSYAYNTSPVSWLNTGTNKLRFRLKVSIYGLFSGTIDDFLGLYNCIVINNSISATPYGGFIVLTIGKENADLILTESNFNNGKFIANINRKSEEF